MLDVPTNGADPTVLGFAEVRDKAQLEAAITKDKDTRSLGKHGDYDLFGSKDDAVVAISADTALISNAKGVTEAAIDRLGGTGDRLADLSTYKDTLASLPSDNIVVGYAPGSVLQKLVTLGRQKDPTGSADSAERRAVRQDLARRRRRAQPSASRSARPRTGSASAGRRC